MKMKLAVWIFCVLLAGMTWLTNAQSSLDNGSADLSPVGATIDARHAANEGAEPAGLTLEKRVAYLRAIEEVNWRRRIWPK